AEGFYRLLHEPSELLEQSEEEPQLERTLHSAALDWYGERLDGDPERESAFMRHFTQLCDLLVHQEPVALADLAQMSAVSRLQAAKHRHLVAYYRALGSGLRNEIGGARQQLAELLNAPDLDDVVRG